MTDTTTLAPTDAEIQLLWDEACIASGKTPAWNRHLRFARAVLAKWGAPAPVAEDVESFDRWLVKQSEYRNYYFDQRGPGLMAVPFARRAYEAGQAAQPAPVAGYALRLEGTDMDAERRKLQHYDDPFVMPPQEAQIHD